MPQTARTYTSVPGRLLELLKSQLPRSISLLRRLQFCNLNDGITPTARIVFVSDTNPEDDSSTPNKFTAAYVDVGGGRDTQMWLYSTLENDTDVDDSETAAVYEEQLTKLVNEIIKLGKDYGDQFTYPGAVLLGSLHSSVREILEKSGRVQPRETGLYDKWLFKREDIPSDEDPLPERMMHWSTATEDDCRVVLSRTNIPRTVKALSGWPSLVIKLEDESPISWAFLSPDGSLASLHCEEPFRRRGLAKTLAAKLFRERTLDFGDDGWSSADVSPDNEASRAMCKSLGGVPHWTVSW